MFNTMQSEGASLKAEGYGRFEEYPTRENLIALEKAKFKDRTKSDEQHLEVGCGVGGFTKSHVLKHCSPCTRLVAVDKSSDMIEVARKTSPHPKIYYDVFDIEVGNVESFLKKYGRFSRVYSLLTFHYLKSQKGGFKNIRSLMKDNAECFVTACLGNPLISSLLEVYLAGKWKSFIPDPRKIYSDMFYFQCNKSTTELESEIRKVVTEAGLRCLDCQVYINDWEFPDSESAVDFVSMSFNFAANFPPEEYMKFKKVWIDSLKNMGKTTPTSCALPFTFYALHAIR